MDYGCERTAAPANLCKRLLKTTPPPPPPRHRKVVAPPANFPAALVVHDLGHSFAGIVVKNADIATDCHIDFEAGHAFEV